MSKRFLALATACGLALAGCTGTISASVPQRPTFAPVSALSKDQARAAIEHVAQVMAEADSAKDVEKLRTVAAGPALTIRAMQYHLAGDEDVKPISFAIRSITPTNETTWPRTMVVAATAEGAAPASVMLFEQEDPRSPYKLWSWGRMFQGETVETIKTELGAAQLPADAPGYVVTPRQAMENYAKVANKFDLKDELHVVIDPAMRTVADEIGKLVEVIGENGKAYFTVEPGAQLYATTTPGKSALVFGTVKYTFILERTVPNAEIKLSGAIADLLGDEPQVKKKVVYTKLQTVVLRLPQKGEDPTLKAVAAELVSIDAKEVGEEEEAASAAPSAPADQAATEPSQPANN